ncbi:MAG: ABC transporter permease [Oscillospiraceae bacterium]
MTLQAVKEKAVGFVSSCGKKEETQRKHNGLKALYRKELADHLNSKRFYLIFCLLLLVTTASLIGAVSNISSAVSESSQFIFLKLFTTGSSSIYSFATFLAFLGPLVGITLGFDAVSNERSQGTLNRLAAQPIYRDSIINAKFLAGTTAIFIIIVTLGLYISAVGLLMIGIPPSFEEILRVIAFLLLAVIYICVWLALSIFFSVICKHAATAALACISIWLFLSLFMGLVANGIASMVYPLEGIEGFLNMMKNYELDLALNRISPYYLFSEAASTILNPNVRSIGIVTMNSYSGAVASSLPFTQSLLLIWPHLVVMAALAMVGFAIAYISFMRQEIRA